MKKILIFAILLIVCVSTIIYSATLTSGISDESPNAWRKQDAVKKLWLAFQALETAYEATTLSDGNYVEFVNAGKIDNTTNSMLSFQEAGEELAWIFGTDKITYYSNKGVATVDHNGFTESNIGVLAFSNAEYISNATDAAIKIGASGTVTEDISLTFSSNAIDVSSASAVGQIDFNSVCPLGLKKIGAFPTGTTMTAAQCHGQVYYCSSAADANLPAAAAGLSLTINTTTAHACTLDVQTGDIFLYSTCSSGDRLASSGAANESITLVAIDGTNWIATSVIGTWTDAN